MDIRELIQRYGVEYIGRFYSSYRGIVTKRDDDNHQGRVEVFIPSIMNGITAWAYPKGIQGGPKTGFKYLTPKIGATVWIEFEKGHPEYPIWSYHPWFKDQMPEELRDNETLGFVTPNGNKIYLQDTDGTLNIFLEGNVNINFKEYIFNDGEIGIPQSTDLVSRFNLLEAKVNTIIDALKNSPTGSQDGGAAYKTAISSAIGDNLTETKVENIASETIKQTK